jgi:hypothetical protein
VNPQPPNATRERPGLLRGISVFLSASVPARPGFPRGSDAAIKVEEAVISFTRAVLREEGTLVFGAHPSISPLVASVAGEYLVPHLRTGPAPEVESIPPQQRTGPGVVIYQSHAFDGYLPDHTWEMYRIGYADLIWCAAKEGEKFDPKYHGPQCPASLRFMRRQMLDQQAPAAMIAIGGMEGIFEEAQLFLDIAPIVNGSFPLYLFESTGGAAQLLAEGEAGDPRFRQCHRVERAWTRAMPEASAETPTRHDPRARPFLPYPLISQWVVKQIAAQHAK